MPIKRDLAFIVDPGHGWLSVKTSDIQALGIAKDITSYSYRFNDRAYLEEDVDTGLFLEAAKKAGWEIKVKVSRCNCYSRIRRMPRWNLN